MMEIMASSKLNNPLFDPIRKKWVETTPEESIRQALLLKMIGELGFPSAFLAVERELALLPSLQLTEKDHIPKRRADIIAFAKNIHPDHALFPLLMVECKSVALTPKFAQQVVGYNSVVKAPFLALANGDEILTGHFDEKQGHYHFEAGLPSYERLLERARGGSAFVPQA